MFAGIRPENCYFFTATVLKWHGLFHQDKYKKILIDSLNFLVREKRVVLYAFVIMPSHIHLIWDILAPYQKHEVQRDFLKFTSQQIKFEVMNGSPSILKKFEVNLKDRTFQIWQRRPMSILLYSYEVFLQKFNYIHRNPIAGKWLLAESEEAYPYSSAGDYAGIQRWPFVTNFFEEP